MTVYRDTTFRGFKKHPLVDPNPGVITDEERAYIDERLDAGAAPRADLIRKLVRLSDARLKRIQELERWPRCARCTGPVEDQRRCYANPVCYRCLPPPQPLPIRKAQPR
jgi:hypothetical protein